MGFYFSRFWYKKLLHSSLPLAYAKVRRNTESVATLSAGSSRTPPNHVAADFWMTGPRGNRFSKSGCLVVRQLGVRKSPEAPSGLHGAEAGQHRAPEPIFAAPLQLGEKVPRGGDPSLFRWRSLDACSAWSRSRTRREISRLRQKPAVAPF
jgi:hypothetical protein